MTFNPRWQPFWPVSISYRTADFILDEPNYTIIRPSIVYPYVKCTLVQRLPNP